MTTTIDHQQPADAVISEDYKREVFERLHALEVTAVRLAEERDTARAEAAQMLRVNLELQRHLNEYGDDRRGYEQRIADLEAENDRLRSADTLEFARYQPTKRGRWRAR